LYDTLVAHWSETLAANHLEQHGFKILELNYRIRGGEIDIIALTPDGTTVFVEVKQRKSNSHGTPGESITARKAMLVRRAALHYLGRDDIACRFDAVLIEGDQKILKLEWIKDAF
jgi:putative endonuclease